MEVYKCLKFSKYKYDNCCRQSEWLAFIVGSMPKKLKRNMTFLNGVAGRSHSHEHAVNSAKIFSQCKPMLVGTGGLTLFPGTPLLEEAQCGEFDPLTEKEMLEELKTFVENLTVDCTFTTHHTVAANLTGPNFLKRKDKIIATLDHAIQHGDMDRMAAYRRNKRTL